MCVSSLLDALAFGGAVAAAAAASTWLRRLRVIGCENVALSLSSFFSSLPLLSLLLVNAEFDLRVLVTFAGCFSSFEQVEDVVELSLLFSVLSFLSAGAFSIPFGDPDLDGPLMDEVTSGLPLAGEERLRSASLVTGLF